MVWNCYPDPIGGTSRVRIYPPKWVYPQVRGFLRVPVYPHTLTFKSYLSFRLWRSPLVHSPRIHISSPLIHLSILVSINSSISTCVSPCIYQSLSPSIHLCFQFISPSVHISFNISIRSSRLLSFHHLVCLPIATISLCIHTSMHTFMYSFIHSYIYPSIYPFICNMYIHPHVHLVTKYNANETFI